MMLDFVQIFVGLSLILLVGSLLHGLAVRQGWEVSIGALPAVGLAAIIIVTTGLWVRNVFLGSIYPLLLLAAATAIALMWYGRRIYALPTGPERTGLAVSATVVLLLAVHGSAVPPVTKLFQGYPWDRFSYVSSSMQYTQETMSFYEDLQRRLLLDGSTRPHWLDHTITSMAVDGLYKRPTTNLVFGLLNYNVKEELYRLGNAYETLLRIFQFLALLYLCRSLIKNPVVAAVAAGALVFGYWFQYIKDFNAWALEITVPLVISAIAVIANSFESKTAITDKLVYVVLFITAACVAYPEQGLFSSACIVAALAAIFILFKEQRRIAVYLALAVLAGTALSFAVNPFNYSYVTWLNERLAEAPDFWSFEKYARSLLNPYTWTPSERRVFLSSGQFHHRWDEFTLIPSIIVGALGLYFLMKGGAIFASVLILLCVAILWKDLTRRLEGLKNSKYAFLLLMCLSFAGATITYLALGRLFPGTRSLSYVLPFIVALFVIYLLNGATKRVMALGYLMLAANVAFGATVFAYQASAKYEHFDQAYGLARDDTIFRRYKGKIRDYYDFDYFSIAEELTKCKRVYLDMANYWHLANIILFLENKDIRYETALPYKTYLFGGVFFGPGKNLEDFKGDCLVSETHDGRVGYGLSRWQN